MKKKIIVIISIILFGCGGDSIWNALTQKTGVSKEITMFGIDFPASTGFIDETSKVISVFVPNGTVLTSLVAIFTITGNSISVGGVDQVSGVTRNDFTSALTYTVTALDGSSSDYTVSVTTAGVDEKDILFFSIAGIDATIENTVISIVLPYGTPLTALIPEITYTGISISPAPGTAQNFENPVTYTVTAVDSSTKSYTVMATTASGNSKDITSFDILGVPGTISGSSISITLPFGTDLSAQIATLVITGSSVNPASGTVQNFTSPVQYTVRAADGSTQVYTVTATVAISSAKEITSFEVDGVSCTISGTTITGNLMSTSNLKALYPIISYNGVNISPASGAKANFNGGSVLYTVTAADGSTAVYTVTITKYLSPTGIVLTPATKSAYISVGGSVNVSVSVLPAGAYQGIAWTNGNASVIHMTASGNTATLDGTSAGISAVTIATIDSGLSLTYFVAVDSGALISMTPTGSGIGMKSAYTMPTGTLFSIIQPTPDTIGSAIPFPTGSNDVGIGSIAVPFIIAQTEVPYSMWGVVYAWAVNNGYSFGYAGKCGSGGYGSMNQPVTSMTWRDAMLWCNALTEYYNAHDSGPDLIPVYYTDGTYSVPMRTVTASLTYSGATPGAEDCPYIYAAANGNTDMANCIATGFRLPTNSEWEYSARYIGTSLPANPNYFMMGVTYYTNGASASGALGESTVQSANTAVAIYSVNSGGSTSQIGLKSATTLGLVDMSGNVKEFCFEWTNQSLHRRAVRGGSYSQTAAYIRVSDIGDIICSSTEPLTGFRPARNR